ncbi:dephospho-CoA kinase [Planctobacterium marinum]|uniref:Dephospho-CoA kinase n=1 Tax=Planctobacterium marinum TaxID=1631968 RepID=A0AA48I476_9ALTE|nr:dephospho-CoA kinase [Planctobacterium marinum]
MSNFIVGLTGGIGSGKTTVSDLFKEHYGIEVVDADVIAREVVQPGSKALAAIRDKFGASILSQEGTLDRAQLRTRVFADPALKTWLNELLHPLIREQMQIQCQQAKSDYVLLSIPLLVENQLQHLTDRILVVDCPEAIQLQRATSRDGVGEAQIKSIMQSQASREQRLAIADDVIVNDTDKPHLLTKVQTLHNKYKAIAQSI